MVKLFTVSSNQYMSIWTDLTKVAVEGNIGWEIMDGLDRTMSDWLGEEPTTRMRQHLETIKSVCLATTYSVENMLTNDKGRCVELR